MDILKKVSKYSHEMDLLPSEGTVLVALSGGADSMCLLHILRSLSGKFGFSLAAAHFNHNLRGAESDGDEAFVRSHCEELGIPFYGGSGDVNAYSAREKLSVEEAARELRYGFLRKTAEELSPCLIATAHSADDDLETLLLRLARGTGLLGLCGIPPKRDNIIRPILCLTREDIEGYLRDIAAPYRDDSSNFSDDYARNRLRHHAVPALKTVNPAVSRGVSETVKLLRADEDFLSSLAAEFLKTNFDGHSISAEALTSAPFPVASRAVRQVCGDGLSARHVAGILSLAAGDDPSARISVPGLTVRREYGRLCFGDAPGATFEPAALREGDFTPIPGAGIAVFMGESPVIHKSFTTFLFKKSAVCGNIVCRPRRTGDKLSFKSGSKSLKKLFIEKKIPAHLRELIPVIADDNGPLAVYGMGTDLRAVPAPGDETISITIEERDKNA